MAGKNEARVRDALRGFPTILVGEEVFSNGNGSRLIRIRIEEREDFPNLKKALENINKENPEARCCTLFARDQQGFPLPDEKEWEVHFHEPH